MSGVTIDERIQARRRDPAFMERLRLIVEKDAAVLARLA